MKQFVCNECLNVFKQKGKEMCKVCGSKDIKTIEVNLEKQTIREI